MEESSRRNLLNGGVRQSSNTEIRYFIILICCCVSFLFYLKVYSSVGDTFHEGRVIYSIQNMNNDDDIISIMVGNQEETTTIESNTDAKATTYVAATTTNTGMNIQNVTTNTNDNFGIIHTEAKNNEHCVLHIHGLHHSGTGFLRQQVYQAVGGNQSASQHEHTRASEDEGQHLQNVYMPYGGRYKNFPENCYNNFDDSKNKERASGRLYYCTDQLSLAENPKAKQQLFDQWSKYWDLSKKYLIQKTPTLDIELLDVMKTHPTVHFVIVRHPFIWHDSHKSALQKHFQTNTDLLRTFQWVDIWSHVFGLLASGKIDSYVVIQYEMLVQYHDEIIEEISHLVQSDCNGNVHHVDESNEEKEGVEDAMDLEDNKKRRKLHLRDKKKDVQKYLLATKAAMKAKKACLNDELCRTMMDEMLPVILQLGYNWEIDKGTAYFDPPESSLSSSSSSSSSKILFSSEAPPPAEFVSKLKTLAERYCR